MINHQTIIDTHCRQYGLSLSLSTAMPEGYETACGTYVPETKTLHLNTALLAGAPVPDALFALYHELRHAEQYQHPERFNEVIRQSLAYVILYNGQCFKQTAQGWHSCKLPGDEAWFTLAYLSLPYELDANEYACSRLEQEGLNADLLRRLWLPADPLPADEFPRLFRQIDDALQA